MPNIELHNFGSGELTIENLHRAANEIKETKKRIWELLEGASYLGDVVVTEILDSSEEHTGKEAPPYLRVWTSDPREHDDIAQRLGSLGFGMELPLLKWIEPRSARSTVQKSFGFDSDFVRMPAGHPDEM